MENLGATTKQREVDRMRALSSCLLVSVSCCAQVFRVYCVVIEGKGGASVSASLFMLWANLTHLGDPQQHNSAWSARSKVEVMGGNHSSQRPYRTIPQISVPATCTVFPLKVLYSHRPTEGTTYAGKRNF